MSILNQLMAAENPLMSVLGDYQSNHVGFVYAINFTEARVLTNDAWKEQVAGVPANSFLVAAAFDPQRLGEAHEFDREIILLRVLGPAPLPSDADLLKTRIEHNQRRTREGLYSNEPLDGMDPITHGELQYGALTCRILGTFYVDTATGALRLGSDLENYASSTRLRVYKPRDKALETIVNHVNPETRAKSLDEARKSGFQALPTPIQIGTVRYTSTARLHRGGGEKLVPVQIQPSDFLGRRTAVLGMTRTGKSNTVKSTVAAVAMSAARDDVKVGQIIFDVNGEYANANHQDDGSSIADVFGERCVRYRAVESGPEFLDLRTNFYMEPAQGLALIQDLMRQDPPPFTGQDLDTVQSATLDEPDRSDKSEHTRWKVLVAVWQCILFKAGYAPPDRFKVEVPLSKHLVEQVSQFAALQDPPLAVDVPTDDKLEPQEACNWFDTLRRINLLMKDAQEHKGKTVLGLVSSTKGKPWVSSVLEAFLNMLAQQTSRKQGFAGYRAFLRYRPYHSPKRSHDVVKEVLAHMREGRIVILDLSAGPVSVRTVLSKKIAAQIFHDSLEMMNQGKVPPNMVVYVEEAHNLVGKHDELTDTWPRLAKEGAKARIAFVYATQEPSAIHPAILSNTENWFVTHLNNDDELKVLGKFYDFADFQPSLKTAQDVGFARVKTLSSPFVVPTQIHRFTPGEIKAELARLSAKAC